MTRRTLDLIFAIGGLVLAILILVLGLVLQSQANFAHDNVHDQLAAQQIYFVPVSALKPNENDPCLKTYRDNNSSPASKRSATPTTTSRST